MIFLKGAESMENEELMYFDKMPNMLPLYLVLKEKLEGRYPFAEIKAAKTQISFRNRHVFMSVSLPYRRAKDWPKEYLLLSLGLGYRKQSERVAMAVEAYPNRWTHHVLITKEEDIDEELLSLIDEAYEFAVSK